LPAAAPEITEQNVSALNAGKVRGVRFDSRRKFAKFSRAAYSNTAATAMQ